MTVCIAAICENGARIVTATDGALSLGNISADTLATKSQWICTPKYGDWQFLFSGTLSNCDLIMEEVRTLLDEDISRASRNRIFSTVRIAFKEMFEKWGADRTLSPFNMEMAEFKRNGVKTFGEKEQGELAREIRADAANNFNEQILVTGWGKSELAAMIYGMSQDGESSHSLVGFAATGSGADTAISTLMLLGHNRTRTLEETLYAVAAAKFASEISDGVKEGTSMFVATKYSPKRKEIKPTGYQVTAEDTKLLRGFWEDFGRPKIPYQVIPNLAGMVTRIGGTPSVGAIFRHIRPSASGTSV